MAKAKAYCKCATCGAEFVQTATKRNCREADEWAAWAVEHFDECPNCFAARMRAEEEATPVTATVKIDPMFQVMYIQLSGNTRPVKDKIKELGFKWTELNEGGVLGFISVSRPKLGWQYQVSGDVNTASASIRGKIAELREAFPELVEVNGTSDVDFAAYLRVSQANAGKRDELESKLAELGPRPEKPECIPAGRWNGKLYGRSGRYSIYVDNAKIDLNDADGDAVAQYISARDDYEAKAAKIKEEAKR